MAVKRSGESWYVHFRPFGSLIKLALKNCENKKQALVVESELLEALRNGVYQYLSPIAREACVRMFVNHQWEIPPELRPAQIGHPAKIFTFWDAVELYVKDPSFTGLSKPVRYEQALAHLVKFLGKKRPVHEIKVSDLKVYRTHRMNEGVTPMTVNREVSCLSSVFRVLIEHDLVEYNPCRQLRRLSEKSGLRQVYICHDDVIKIASACPEWYRDLAMFSYYTGARRGELVDLRWSNVNLKQRMITLLPDQTKEALPKKIPLHVDAMKILERLNRVRSLKYDQVFMIDGRPINEESLKNCWQRAMNKLNWPRPRPRFHDLRASFRTNCRRSALNPEITEQILGHAGRMKSVQERYGFVSERELIDQIDKLSWDHGESQIVVARRG